MSDFQQYRDAAIAKFLDTNPGWLLAYLRERGMFVLTPPPFQGDVREKKVVGFGAVR